MNLAGGVAEKGQLQLFRGDAAAVVSNADQALSALLKLDFDARCAGIDAVLRQLLDHGRRTLDHLASSDLVDQYIRENLNRHGRALSALCDSESGIRPTGPSENSKNFTNKRAAHPCAALSPCPQIRASRLSVLMPDSQPSSLKVD